MPCQLRREAVVGDRPRVTRRSRTGRRLLAGSTGVALLMFAVTVWLHYQNRSVVDIASDATVSASSVARANSLSELVDGDRLDDPTRGWFTKDRTIGAWFQLEWPQRHGLRRIVLQRNSLDDPGIRGGYLTFGDGSELQVTLSTTSRTTVIPIGPRRVDKLRFTVSSVSTGASAVGLTHVAVYDESQAGDVASDGGSGGNAAGAASISVSTTTSAGSLGALVDGGRPGGDVDSTWGIAQPEGASVLLHWARPRELNSISVTGAKGSTALRSGSLVFSDGSRLTLGAVLADPTRPTVVSFMPRITTSLKLIFDSVSGPGPLVLSDVSADERSTATFVPVAGQQSVAVPQASCANPLPRPTDTVGLIVQCPISGSEVAGRTSLKLSVGPSYETVTATILPGDGNSPVRQGPTVAVSPDGTATVGIDLQTLPSGPFTVRVDAAAAGRPSREALLQLDEAGTASAYSEPTASVSARGRSLVYADEFTQPLSISRTGAGATYAASKPIVTGVQDFGDAIFADPALKLGNFDVVNNQYLRIAVEPRPQNFADPGNYRRQYVGGLLSSARPGGSGFSAQYGYFEARMLVPEAPGTWPAFWMLPNPNLVVPEKTVAEIDAVELYGHQPTGSCQSTHQFFNGKDGGVVRCSSARWESVTEAARWHTYGVSIAPDTVTFFIDDVMVASSPQVRGGSDPMFFLVDLALGGGWPVDLTSVRGHANLYVDYVRVYV